MNVTVIRGKDLLKYLVEIVIALVIIAWTTSFFNKDKKEEKESQIEQIIQNAIENVKENSFTSLLEITLPMLKSNQEETVEEKNIQNEILGIHFGMASYVKPKEETNLAEEGKQLQEEEEKQSEEQQEQTTDDGEIQLASTDVTVQQVEENNITPSYTDEYNGIQIKNQSSYAITEDLFSDDYQFTNTEKILIFHTHTCESYTPTETYNYQMSGNYRTTDLNYSVARVGDELEKQLTAYGYYVLHDKTYHDYPAYNGSYGRSEATVKNILTTDPDVQTIIDLHRDAVGSSSAYAPSVLIGEESAAQLMLVIGTDGGGLDHPNWRENLKLAIKIQKKANELYPGLFRPIILRDSRYNQHVSTGAMIIEVGATGNTMEQCLVSMKYLAKVLSEVIQ